MTHRLNRLAAVSATLGLALAVAVATTAPAPLQAQGAAPAQDGRGRGAAPPAARGAFAPPPIVWAAPALPDGPITTQTALDAHRNVRITVTKGLSHPWAMAFLPDGGILVTERGGQLRLVRGGTLDPTPVAGVPAVAAGGLRGLMDLALHPDFAENRWVYFTYHKPSGNAPAAPPAGRGGRGAAPVDYTLALGRGTWNGAALTDVRVVFDTGADGSASRLVFGRDGMIYMSSGNAAEVPNAPPQDPNDLRGKVLRLRDDGSVPPDNPFVGRAGYRPEIFTLGHRTQLGMAVNPETGEIWAAEQGPNGGDEINVLQAGKNYGWPLVSHGRSYMGARIGGAAPAGLEEPIVFWVPSIAASGLAFYTGDAFPGWRNSVFVGALRQGEVPRTGHLQRIEFNEEWQELRREPLLRELQQRIRDVRQGPDGYLYVLTEEDDAALLRLEPGPPATP